MSGIVVDTSVWIDFFAGQEVPALEEALARGAVVLTPLVVAELISGVQTAKDRHAIAGLLADLRVHETPIEHWIAVGDLRRELKARHVPISTPDAHIAQCALDLDAPLLSRDRVFARVSEVTRLRVLAG